MAFSESKGSEQFVDRKKRELNEFYAQANALKDKELQDLINLILKQIENEKFKSEIPDARPALQGYILQGYINVVAELLEMKKEINNPTPEYIKKAKEAQQGLDNYKPVGQEGTKAKEALLELYKGIPATVDETYKHAKTYATELVTGPHFMSEESVTELPKFSATLKSGTTLLKNPTEDNALSLISNAKQMDPPRVSSGSYFVGGCLSVAAKLGSVPAGVYLGLLAGAAVAGPVGWAVMAAIGTVVGVILACAAIDVIGKWMRTPSEPTYPGSEKFGRKSKEFGQKMDEVEIHTNTIKKNTQILQQAQHSPGDSAGLTTPLLQDNDTKGPRPS